MKKIVCFLLIACLFIGSVFAATLDTDEVRVRAKVGTISIQDAVDNAIANGEHLYNLFVGLTSAESAASKDVTSEKDPTEEDVVAYFRVYQQAKVKNNETAHLAFAVSPLYFNGLVTSDATKLVAPVVSDIKANVSTLFTVQSTNVTDTGFTFNVGYTKQNPVADTDIGYFKATWAKTDDLEDGDYSASITMTLTAN